MALACGTKVELLHCWIAILQSVIKLFFLLLTIQNS